MKPLRLPSRIALVVLTCLCVLTACANQQNAPISATPQSAMVMKELGQFSPIPGTKYLRAPIVIRASQSSGFSLSSSGYVSDRAYNYVYFNQDSQTFQQLIPTNDSVIVFNEDFPKASTPNESERVISWFLYGVVKQDTNGDKDLSARDLKTLAVSDAGGQGYTELIDNVETVYGHTLRDPTTLLVIYRSTQKTLLSTIDLPQRKVSQTVELPSFGPDVQ